MAGDRAAAGPSVRNLSIRVALVASGIVLAAYVVIAVAVFFLVTAQLTGDIDSRLSREIASVPNVPGPDQPFGPNSGVPDRPFGLPVLMWRISPDGSVSSLNTSDIKLSTAYRGVTGPETVTISGVEVRIEGAQRGEDFVVVGLTMDGVHETQSTLLAASVGIGAALLIAVFLGAVAIGRRVALPIERARQRQLEFTADASHELRTPLSVMEAQTSLASARNRDAMWDGSAFGRIDSELKRTRRLVDDMLWLARFDSTAPTPAAEPMDLNVLAAHTADRFASVAEARGLKLAVQPADGDPIVTAPAEWLDRLLGVLLDNACKYSPAGGSVAVSVSVVGRRVRLAVDDAGPGIPEADRERIFDRFHRGDPGTEGVVVGAGLGLAIGDAIVRASGGRWQIGTSAAGGASVAVSWPRHSLD